MNIESGIKPIGRGDSIGRFVVVDELGRGGMGVVVSAYDPELDRRVAIKVLRPQRAGSDEARERLLREAKAMAKLRHPNAVTVYEVGTHGDQVFLAMEFAEGGSLGAWLAEPRDQKEVVAAFVAAGRGLAAAHRASLIHRDFKPENVLRGAEGRVQVTDFGLVNSWIDLAAPRAADSDPSLTQTGSVLGTPAYMSPEQLRGERVDERTDQFSFCVALWEALHGERPFPGKNFGELKAAVLGTARPLARKGSRVPRWIEEILQRGLARAADDRFESMDDLLEELDRDDNDAEIGRATRAGAVAVLGSVWTLGPIICLLSGLQPQPAPWDIVVTTLLAAITAPLAYVTRDSIGASVFNRQMRAVIVCVFLAQYALAIGVMVGGQSDDVLHQMTFFSWFVAGLVSVFVVERRLAPTAIGYLAAFVVVGHDQSLFWWAMSASNGALTLNCLWIWRPRGGLRGRFRRRSTPHRGLLAASATNTTPASVSLTAAAVADTVAATDDTQLSG